MASSNLAITINVRGKQAEAALKLLQAIAAAASGATTPQVVATQGMEAQRRSIGRIRSAALAFEPTTVLV